MTTRKTKCPKCAHAMEKGFVLDHFNWDYGSTHQKRWAEGDAVPTSQWYGGAVNMSRKRILKVVTFRCTGCGFLESFAR